MSDIIFYIGIENRNAYQRCFNLTSIDNEIHIGEQIERYQDPNNNSEIIIVCNGNIYNYKQLAKDHAIEEVKSDKDLIIKLYKKYGMLISSRLLYGEFSFILLEIKELPIYEKKFIVDCYIVNDNLGVKPLFIGFNDNGKVCGVSSKDSYLNGMNVKLFPPGFYLSNLNQMVKYTQLFEFNQDIGAKKDPNSVIINNVKLFVKNAIKIRSEFGEKNIAFLLENSFNSALINKFLEDNIVRIPIFDSKDRGLEFEEVAYIIKEVITIIASYEIPFVRRGVLLYLLARWMRKNSKYEVIICSEAVVGAEMIICQKCFNKFGIEVRFPLVDQKIIKYLASVGNDHQLFQQVFTDVLIDKIIAENEIYLSTIREYIDKTIVSEESKEEIDKEKIFYKNIYEEYFEKR